MKLNLDDRGVYEASMSVAQARKAFDEGLPEEVMTKLDEAQGFVHSGEGNKSYLVIEITG